MGTAFSHPSGNMLLRRITDIFKARKTSQRRDRVIIFLCGGPVRAYSRSMRQKFLKHFKEKLPYLTIILAEPAIQDIALHNEQDFFNLAHFENIIVDISDCILIFPESPGSIAELGFFTNSDIALKKILVVNDIDHQIDSFINTGLIDRINSESNFRPALNLSYANSDFRQLEERIKLRLPKKTKDTFSCMRFNDVINTKQKMFLIFQILYIFRLLTYEDVVYCSSKIFKYVFKNVNKDEISYLLSILIAGNYISRVGADSEYFIPSIDVEPFFVIRNYEFTDLSIDTLSFYRKYHPETYEIHNEVYK